MGKSIRLLPFDWGRYSKLSAAFAEGRKAEAAALLAEGPAWKDPQAAARLAAFEARGDRPAGISDRVRARRGSGAFCARGCGVAIGAL